MKPGCCNSASRCHHRNNLAFYPLHSDLNLENYHLHPCLHNRRNDPVELDATRSTLTVDALTVLRCQPGDQMRRRAVVCWGVDV